MARMMLLALFFLSHPHYTGIFLPVASSLHWYLSSCHILTTLVSFFLSHPHYTGIFLPVASSLHWYLSSCHILTTLVSFFLSHPHYTGIFLPVTSSLHWYLSSFLLCLQDESVVVGDFGLAKVLASTDPRSACHFFCCCDRSHGCVCVCVCIVVYVQQ